MSTAAPAGLITAEEFARMQFDRPVELVRGEIVEMGQPDLRHGTVCANVCGEIRAWARAANAGRVAANDSGIITQRDPDTVRGADVVFVRAESLVDGRMPSGVTDLVPDLCVEVLSPYDRWKELHHKLDEYLERGVPEVWVVNPEDRTVEVFRTDDPPRRFSAEEEITSRVLPGFSCRVAQFFEGA